MPLAGKTIASVILACLAIALIAVTIYLAVTNNDCSSKTGSGTTTTTASPSSSSSSASASSSTAASRDLQPKGLLGSIPSTTAQAFDTMNSSNPVGLLFYSESCGYCVKMAPEVEKAASQLKGQIDIYKISVSQAGSLMQKYKVSGVPSLVKVWPQSGQFQHFSGARTAADIFAFLKPSSSPSSKVAKLDDALFQQVVLSLPCILMVWSASCPESTSAIPAFETASTQSDIPFFELEASVGQIFLQNYQISQFPTILTFNPTVRNVTPYVMTAPISAQSIADFAQTAKQ